MKLIKCLSSILLLTLIFPAFGEEKSDRDKINEFYTALLTQLESNYLHRSTTDWTLVRTLVSEKTSQVQSFEEALPIVTDVFDAIKCNHCQLFSKENHYTSTLNPQFSQGDFSREFLLEYEKQTPFHVKIIDDNIGYINIPGMLLIDLTHDELNLETQKMYDAIAKTAKENSIKGWVIDLRFNIGGNVYPMLASLHYFLGNNVMYKGLNHLSQVTQSHTLKDGGFYTGKKLEAKANLSIKPNLKTPVALIVGKMTASAGEDILVAFKGRKNTTTIGEKSYGFLTGNDMFDLPYDNKIALTVSYIADQNNIYQKYITPDILISKKDNFEDISKDENIVQALRFIKTQQK